MLNTNNFCQIEWPLRGVVHAKLFQDPIIELQGNIRTEKWAAWCIGNPPLSETRSICLIQTQ